MTTDSAHPLRQTRAFMQRSFQIPKDLRPQAACPTCYLNSYSDEPGQRITFLCPKGHEFLQTRTASEAHAVWLARYFTTQERNV